MAFTLDATQGGAVGCGNSKPLSTSLVPRLITTYPIFGQIHIEMQRQILPRSTRGCQNQAELSQVSIVGEDGNPRIRIILQLSEVLVEAGKQATGLGRHSSM